MARYTTIQINDIIKRYDRAMFYFVLGKTAYNNVLAKDLYQDASIKIFLGLRAGKYKKKGSAISTWMYTVCSNVITDYYRGLKGNPAAPNKDLFDEEMAQDDTRFHKVVQQIMVNQDIDSKDREDKQVNDFQFRLIEHYINKIKNDKLREPFYMQIVLGYSGKEIAKRLDVTYISVRTHIFRAKKELRILMAADGVAIKEEAA